MEFCDISWEFHLSGLIIFIQRQVLVDQWIRMLSEFIDAGHDMILAADSLAFDVFRGIASLQQWGSI